MKSIPLLNIAAVIAALTVLAIAYILVPEPRWTLAAIITAIGFAGSVGFVFYVPSILRGKRSGTDAQQMAAIGPLSLVSLLLLLAMSVSFVLALAGYEKLALAMLVLGVGLLLVAYLILSAALKVVENISAKGTQISHHVDWQGRVSILASTATHEESVAKLRAFGEKLRYSPNDMPGGSPQDAAIEQAFEQMSAQLQTDPAVNLTNQFGALDGLLAQRDTYLRSARGRA
ncbi:MAG: hypothetical protein LBR88_04440 [Zoogloeaceae bacterium]|jgi:hypothetical protein|nr:hypothetical protein [Zoogloeaceae bacterium]